MLLLLIEKKGMDRIILLLEILNIASKATDYSLLSSPAFSETIYNGDSRVNHVFEFVMGHFSNQITLEEVAEVANMNKTAFYRYFKEVTKKSLPPFLMRLALVMPAS